MLIYEGVMNETERADFFLWQAVQPISRVSPHINVHVHINVHRSITHCRPTLVVEELVWVYTVWYGKAYAPFGMYSAHKYRPSVITRLQLHRLWHAIRDIRSRPDQPVHKCTLRKSIFKICSKQSFMFFIQRRLVFDKTAQVGRIVWSCTVLICDTIKEL